MKKFPPESYSQEGVEPRLKPDFLVLDYLELFLFLFFSLFLPFLFYLFTTCPLFQAPSVGTESVVVNNTAGASSFLLCFH